jgi:hypothetical protein
MIGVIMSSFLCNFQRFVFAVPIVVCLLLFWGCDDSSPVLPGGLYATPTVCDLGVVVDKDKITGDFQIVNTNNKKINIREVKLSCGCADIQLSKETIPANGFIDAKLTVTLEGKYGPNSFEVLIFTDDTTVPIIPLRLNTNVAVKKLDGTIFLNLGLFFPEEKIDQVFTTLPGKVKAIAVKDVQYSSSFPTIPDFVISAVPTLNQDVRLNIKGAAPSQNGEFSIDLNLIGDDADWGIAHLLLQGTVRPEISIPATVYLGFIEPNRSNKMVVKIVGVADFLSKYPIDTMTVTHPLSKILNVQFTNSPSPQLEFTLQHPGTADSFTESVELDFTFSNGKKVQLSTNVAARFL